LPVAVAALLEVVLVAVPDEDSLDVEVVVAAAVFAVPDEVDVGATVLVKAMLVSSAVPFRTRIQLAATGSPRPESWANFSISKGSLLERSGLSTKNAAYVAGTLKSSG